MMSPDDKSATRLADLERAFGKQGVRVQWTEDGSLFTEGEIESGRVAIHIYARDICLPECSPGEPMTLIEVLVILPDRFACPSERRGPLVELMGALNGEIALGRFEFDRDTARPRYRVTALDAGAAEAAPLLGSISDGLQVIEGHAKGLLRVIDGQEPAHVYVDVLLEGEDTAELPTAARSWLLDWLQVATNAYVVREDADGLVAVASLAHRLLVGQSES